MSDLRFLKELGTEFERIGETDASARRSDRGRRWMRGPRSAIANGVTIGLPLLAVVAVAAVAFSVHTSGVHTSRRAGSPPPTAGIRIAFSATAVDPRSLLGPSIDRSIDILRQRLGAVFHGVQVSRAGDGLVVLAPHARRADRARIVALAVPARLEFYDWEANALTSNGKTVASQLQAQDRTAVEISQGGAGTMPGGPGAGSLPLYEAVKLASQQPPSVSVDNARDSREYYLFGAPGSPACATAAQDQNTIPVAGAHCMLLSQPLKETTTNRQIIAGDVASALLPGVKASQGQQLVVSHGTVVLLAAQATAGQQTSFSSPSAQFFVLKDNVALFGKDITSPVKSTDQSGQPDVTFGFDSAGASKFQQVTARIAHRGALVSAPVSPFNQHFAVALDNQLITVPFINFKQYPDGVIGRGGVDITGGFTVQSARDLAILLRYRPLPVSLAAR